MTPASVSVPPEPGEGMVEWLTLPEAAERLGISPRTARRWIREGRLRAELRPGAYGDQYFVPVVPGGAPARQESGASERPPDVTALTTTLTTLFDRLHTELVTVREGQAGMIAAADTLRAEVARALQQYGADQAAREQAHATELHRLGDELAALRVTLARLEQEQRRERRRLPWWRRLLGG